MAGKDTRAADRVVREIVETIGQMYFDPGGRHRGPVSGDVVTRTREAEIPRRFEGEGTTTRRNVRSAEANMLYDLQTLLETILEPVIEQDINDTLRRGLEPMPPRRPRR